MTILTAAEDGTVNGATRDVHLHVAHIGTLVEEHALVALASTEEVAGNGVSANLFQRARHTKRGRAAEVNGTLASRLNDCCRFAITI